MSEAAVDQSTGWAPTVSVFDIRAPISGNVSGYGSAFDSCSFTYDAQVKLFLCDNFVTCLFFFSDKFDFEVDFDSLFKINVLRKNVFFYTF